MKHRGGFDHEEYTMESLSLPGGHSDTPFQYMMRGFVKGFLPFKEETKLSQKNSFN